MVCGTEDGEIFLWKLDECYSLQFTIKGRPLKKTLYIFSIDDIIFLEHTAKINCVTFEPDSNNIISCSSNKSLIVFDVHTSTKIYSTILVEEPMSFSWIASFLLIGDKNGFLQVWDPQTAAFVSKFHCHEGNLIAIKNFFTNQIFTI